MRIELNLINYMCYMQAQYKFVCECIVEAYNKILEEEDETKQSTSTWKTSDEIRNEFII